MQRTCDCGGAWLRHGQIAPRKSDGISGIRYRCKRCGKSIVIRDGERTKVGRPIIRDWRMS